MHDPARRRELGERRVEAEAFDPRRSPALAAAVERVAARYGRDRVRKLAELSTRGGGVPVASRHNAAISATTDSTSCSTSANQTSKAWWVRMNSTSSWHHAPPVGHGAPGACVDTSGQRSAGTPAGRGVSRSASIRARSLMYSL